MRRIQIYIDVDLDEALQAEAARTGKSKAALIRECVATRFSGNKAAGDDPITALIGTVDAEPENHDQVVYDR
jgi:hypothetical protein